MSVMDEVELTVENGIGYSRYEVYEYLVTQDNHEVGDGAYFVVYIINFWNWNQRLSVIPTGSTFPKTMTDKWTLLAERNDTAR